MPLALRRRERLLPADHISDSTIESSVQAIVGGRFSTPTRALRRRRTRHVKCRREPWKSPFRAATNTSIKPGQCGSDIPVRQTWAHSQFFSNPMIPLDRGEGVIPEAGWQRNGRFGAPGGWVPKRALHTHLQEMQIPAFDSTHGRGSHREARDDEVLRSRFNRCGFSSEGRNLINLPRSSDGLHLTRFWNLAGT